MLAGTLALLLLSPAAADRPSAEDAPAVLAAFESMAKSGAIGPCKRFFPEHAAEFGRAYESWLRGNSGLIERGERIARAAAESGGAQAAPFDVREAEAQTSSMLRDLPVKERLRFCRQYF